MKKAGVCFITVLLLVIVVVSAGCIFGDKASDTEQNFEFLGTWLYYTDDDNIDYIMFELKDENDCTVYRKSDGVEEQPITIYWCERELSNGCEYCEIWFGLRESDWRYLVASPDKDMIYYCSSREQLENQYLAKFTRV